MCYSNTSYEADITLILADVSVHKLFVSRSNEWLAHQTSTAVPLVQSENGRYGDHRFDSHVCVELVVIHKNGLAFRSDFLGSAKFSHCVHVQLYVSGKCGLLTCMSSTVNLSHTSWILRKLSCDLCWAAADLSSWAAADLSSCAAADLSSWAAADLSS